MAQGHAGEVMWTPSADRIRGARLTEFIRFVRARGVEVPEGDYPRLLQWSVDDLDGFWETLAAFFDVRFEAPPRVTLGRREMPGAEWFVGSRLSYPEHAFRDRRDGDVAIIAAGESRAPASLTWADLRKLTERVAGALRALGVGPGDRVAGYLPNVPETVAVFLAAASLGATWASCSPDFGPTAVLDRLAQIEPAVLFAVDGYRYGGTAFDRREVVAELVRRMPGLRATVTLPYLDADAPASALPGGMRWDDFLATGDGRALAFAPVPFDHPLWVLYSSGTTGLPKGLVHSHGGILLEHLKWLGLQVDAGPEDRLFWLTTTGWTMWNFLVGGLLTVAAIVLYDGSPGHPGLGELWDLAESVRITCFGAGAAFFAACMRSGVRPADGRDLSSLRAVGSTGSPLHPEAYDWVYREVGDDIWLFSTSGGTDVCTAFVGGTPLLPVRRGELQAPALGVDLQSWDEEGRRLDAGVGELVVTQPMPSMPVRLWNDPDGEWYRAAYFDTYPGVWRHGDWIEMRPPGAVIHGRSDATINRGGVRMGSSEIYRAILSLPGLADAVVVDVSRGEGETDVMLLFVVLGGGVELDGDLDAAIRRRLRTECSPRHVPDEIVSVPAIPRTLSGKNLETPLRRLLAGASPEAVASRGSLANPEALDWFARFAAEWRAAEAAGR
jgi:acetoacetyl-CoA synthetase